METVHIRRFETHYRMPRAALPARGRLERVMRDVLDDGVEAALERIGIRPDAVICIRRLDVPVRLRLAAPDSMLVAGWSLELAAAIARALERGDRDVVHYPSRTQALLDLVASVARGSLGRRWAWRQAGLWHGEPAAADAVVAALLAEPTSIVAVLVALARTDVFSALVALLPDAAWPALAAAAVTAAGAGPATLLADAAREDGESSGAGAAGPSSPADRAHAEVLLAGSRLASAWRRVVGTRVRPEVAKSVAALCALEVDPGLARRSTRFTRGVAAAMASTLRGEAARDGAPGVRLPADVMPPADVAPAGDVAPPADVATSAADATPATQPRDRARTRHGGLLFLLHVVGELGLHDRLAAAPCLEERGLRWILHRLGLHLLPEAEPDDPALLAFAGLQPTAEAPWRGAPEPSPDEALAIGEGADALVTRLVERLGPPARLAPMTVPRLCRRDAEIVADPGWIEVRLSLDDVSTEIRRAALDLDLGWVPWLGAVVRFVYA